jgi:hypothetical protein
MRPFPHGVLDTSAESIPNFETKNKVCDAFGSRTGLVENTCPKRNTDVIK